MEFIKANFLNTTTQITVNSNTGTTSNLFNTDPFYQYYTDGLNNDATTGTITVTFDATTYVSRIALLDHNLKSFTIYYNGATANTFTFSGGATTTSSFTSNSETSQYFRCSTVACTSITIDMKTTQVANSEKAIGNLYFSDLELTLSQLPSANNFSTNVTTKQIVHTMADGGTRVHNVRRKWQTNIKLEYIPATLRDSLFDLYKSDLSFIFCPFGTSTGWDAQIFDSVWHGNFDFYQYADDAPATGFSGTIRLKETPS